MTLTKKYYLITALLNAYFPLGIWVLYFVERWGYSFTKAMVIFSVSFAISLILDFVGGVHADVIGRKKSAVIGIVFQIVGCLVVAYTGNFPALLVSSVLLGVGLAMVSGSLDALVIDELGVDSKEFRAANSNVQMYLFFARVVASTIGGFAYILDKPLPFILTAMAYATALIVTITIRDSHTKQPDHESSHARLIKSSLKTVLQNTTAIKLSFAILFGIFAGDLVWTYYQPFFKSVGWSPAYLGLLFAGISLVSAAGSRLSIKVLRSRGPQFVFGLSSLTVIVNAVILLQRRPLLSLIGVGGMAVMSGMNEPAIREFFGSIATKKNRATMLSLGTSIESLGVLGGFLLGGVLLDANSGSRLLLYTIVSALLCLVLVASVNRPAAKNHE